MINSMYWLIAAVSAYLFFGVASLGDKLVLSGKPKPKSYTFYVGAFGLLAVFLIPFAKFNFSDSSTWMWIALDGLVHVLGLYIMYVAVEKFDISKVVATIGATQPIFIFILTWLFWGPQVIHATYILAFIILFLGSIIISFEKNIKMTGRFLALTIISSILFSFDYIFVKFIFLSQTFLPGIILIEISIFFFAALFIFNKNARKEIFSKQMVLDRKTQATFLATQICGGVGNFLQAFAISLAPVVFLATINSLRGVQYVSLFIITLFISYFFPKILKEEISKKIIIQKIISIILILIGLTMLAIG